ADPADKAVSRRPRDEFLEGTTPALGGDDERCVLHEAPVVHEICDVLARGPLAGRAPAGNRVGATVVETDIVAFDDLGEVCPHVVEVDRVGGDVFGGGRGVG